MNSKEQPVTLESSIKKMAQEVGVPEELHGDYQTFVLRRLQWEAMCYRFPSVAISGNVPEEDVRLIRRINRALQSNTEIPEKLREIVERGGVPHKTVWVDGEVNPLFTLPAETHEADTLRNLGLKQIAEAKEEIARLRKLFNPQNSE